MKINVSLGYLFIWFLAVQVTNSMELDAEANDYENHKQELLRQAEIIVPHAKDFFKIFAQPFPQDLESAQNYIEKCDTFYQFLKKLGLVDFTKNKIVHDRIMLESSLLMHQSEYLTMKKQLSNYKRRWNWVGPKRFLKGENYNSEKFFDQTDCLEILNRYEYGDQTNLRYDHTEAKIAIKAKWHQAILNMPIIRKKMLELWPQEQRENAPYIAIAAFLNEVESPILPSGKPQINPKDL